MLQTLLSTKKKMPKITVTNSFASKRAQVLKTCKNTEQMSYKGTKLDAEVPNIQTEIFPSECQPFYNMDLDVSIYKKRGGEMLPKVVQSGDKRKKTVTFWLPPMEVKYAQLGKNGNLGKFTEDPKKAKFSVSLIPSDMNEKGTEAIEFIKKWCDNVMGSAFHDEDTWKSLTDEHEDDKSFIEGAQHSIIKELEDEEECICLNRRLEGWSGEPNQPVFWKIKQDGTYEQVHPKFIRQGTVLMVQMTFRAYKIPGRYGMAGDLGRHILVVKTPEKKKPKAPFNVPYIPFELD